MKQHGNFREGKHAGLSISQCLNGCESLNTHTRKIIAKTAKMSDCLVECLWRRGDVYSIGIWRMCLDLNNVSIALCIESKLNGKFRDETTLTDFLLLLQHSIKGQI